MIKSYLIYCTRYLCAMLPGSPFRSLRVRLWRLVGVDIDKTANVYPRAVFESGGESISVGAYTFIGNDVLVCGGSITIGKNCDFAPRAIVHAGTHKIGNSERRAGITYPGKIVIGDGTWVGVGAIILSGANIGKGSMIAANSVVKAGDYPDNALLAGCPAVVKKIFEN